MIEIREAQDADWAQLWGILAPVFQAGETYTIAVDINESDAQDLWLNSPTKTFVAIDSNNKIAGTYYLKPNQAGNGNHVCNCGYIVNPDMRGQGLATLLCTHSQQQARIAGYTAMQFNFVASSNWGAVRLWQKLGFNIVGSVPNAFNHPKLGYVNAYIMHKHLF